MDVNAARVIAILRDQNADLSVRAAQWQAIAEDALAKLGTVQAELEKHKQPAAENREAGDG